MPNDFELVESKRSQSTKMLDAVADNFGAILDIAKDIAEIQKMKVQSEAVLAKMAEDRKTLLAEAESYAIKKGADTKNVVDRMRMIQDLLRDFYIYNQTNPSGLSGEDFSAIVKELLSKTE